MLVFYFFINSISNKPPPYKISIIDEEPLPNNEESELLNDVPIFVKALGILLNPVAKLLVELNKVLPVF